MTPETLSNLVQTKLSQNLRPNRIFSTCTNKFYVSLRIIKGFPLGFTAPIKLTRKLIKQLIAEQKENSVIDKMNHISRSLMISKPPDMTIEIKNKSAMENYNIPHQATLEKPVFVSHQPPFIPDDTNTVLSQISKKPIENNRQQCSNVATGTNRTPLAHTRQRLTERLANSNTTSSTATETTNTNTVMRDLVSARWQC